jgi:hypothetical protein
MPRLLSFQPSYGLWLCGYDSREDQTNMKETGKTKIIWQEWDAFCDPLLAGTGAVDSGKSLPDHQTSDQYQLSDCSKELDLYLRLAFEPNPDSTHPDMPELFAETPPLLEQALALRIAHATVLLKKILETDEGPKIQSESDLVQATHLSFRDLLLPSPPKPGDYTWETPVR